MKNYNVLLLFFILPFLFSEEKIIQPVHDAHPLLIKRINIWIEELKNPAKADQAEKKLIKIGQISDQYLINAFKNGDRDLKKRIIRIFAQLKSQKAKKVLLQCATNEKENPRVREIATSTLGIYKSEETYKALMKLAFHSDSRIHRPAAYALCRIKDKDVIFYLISLLKHWNENLRKKAVLQLISITKNNTISKDYAVWKKWWDNHKDILDEMNK